MTHSFVTIHHGACIFLKWHAFLFHLLPALLASSPRSRPLACSGPGQAEEEVGCRCGNLDLPWFLHLSLALGKTCRKGSEPQEMHDFEKQTHTHTRANEGLCRAWGRTGRADACREGFLEGGGFELGFMAWQDLEKE